MGGKNNTIIVMVSDDMKKQIKRFCKEFDVSMSHLVRRAVVRELETDNKKPKKPWYRAEVDYDNTALFGDK